MKAKIMLKGSDRSRGFVSPYILNAIKTTTGRFDKVCNALGGLEQGAENYIGQIAADTGKHASNVAQEAAKTVGPVIGVGIRCADLFGQVAGKHVRSAMQGAAEWIEEHSSETAGIIACAIAAPVTIAVTGQVLGTVGFAAHGVVGGFTAAAYQSTVGNIAAGSVFATLQGARAGGSGAAIVNGVVASATTGVAAAAEIPGLMKAITDKKSDAEVSGTVDAEGKEA